MADCYELPKQQRPTKTGNEGPIFLCNAKRIMSNAIIVPDLR